MSDGGPSQHLQACGPTGLCDHPMQARHTRQRARTPGPQVHGTFEAQELIFYPGDRGIEDVDDVDETGNPIKVPTMEGSIYVSHLKGVRIDAAGGPEPSQGVIQDAGGHTASATPAGHYVLGPMQHVSTQSWPSSVIPFGAQLSQRDGETVYRSDGGKWTVASGPHGTVTQARLAFEVRTRNGRALGPKLRKQLIAEVRTYFFNADGSPMTEWKLNDFGRWSWNLMQNGSRTPYYLHTTPDNERDTENHTAFKLAQSHGCVHIRPADRDDWVKRRFIRTGIRFTVKRYSDKGPPR